MARMQESMARRQPPVAELVHGFFLFLAGVFLFIPGFLTDTLGVLLLLPPVRILLGRSGLRRFAAAAESGAAGRPDHGRARNNLENIEIEGVYWEESADGGAGAEPAVIDQPGDQPGDQPRGQSKGRRED